MGDVCLYDYIQWTRQLSPYIFVLIQTAASSSIHRKDCSRVKHDTNGLIKDVNIQITNIENEHHTNLSYLSLHNISYSCDIHKLQLKNL